MVDPSVEPLVASSPTERPARGGPLATRCSLRRLRTLGYTIIGCSHFCPSDRGGGEDAPQCSRSNNDIVIIIEKTALRPLPLTLSLSDTTLLGLLGLHGHPGEKGCNT